jgi:threonine aldolase
VSPEEALRLGSFLKSKGVVVLARSPMRLVTHLDVDRAGIERALAVFRSARL